MYMWRCLRALVSQPDRDHGDIDPGLEQMHRRRVPQACGAKSAAPSAWCKFSAAARTASWSRSSTPDRESGLPCAFGNRGDSGSWPIRDNHFRRQSRRAPPQRDDPLLPTLAIDPDRPRRAQRHVRSPQADRFGDSSSRCCTSGRTGPGPAGRSRSWRLAPARIAAISSRDRYPSSGRWNRFIGIARTRWTAGKQVGSAGGGVLQKRA